MKEETEAQQIEAAFAKHTRREAATSGTPGSFQRARGFQGSERRARQESRLLSGVGRVTIGV